MRLGWIPLVPLAAAAAPLAGAATPPKTQLGTKAPVTVEDAAPDGSWVVACQARNDTDRDGKLEVHVGHHGDTFGDDLEPYLIVGSGAGDALDAFVAADPTGRWIAAIKKKKLVLIDTKTRVEVDLSASGADTVDDGNPFTAHRAASFDAAGTQMVYLKKGKNGSRVVVRELATGTEQEIDPGAGLLWRAEVSGEWVVIQMIPRDTDSNGTIEWPRPHTSLSGRACRGPIRSYSTYGRSGDDPETRVAAIGEANARVVSELVRPLGAALVRRAAKGELILERKDGSTSELVPRACGARILGVHDASGVVLVSCTKRAKQGSAPLELHSATSHRALGMSGPTPDRDNWYVRPRAVVEIDIDGGEAIVDLEQGVARKLASDDRFVAAHQGVALLRRGDELVSLDVVSGKETSMGKQTGYPSALAEGTIAVGHTVLDFVAAKALGTVSSEILAVTRDGRALIAAGTAGAIPEGPLEWVAPK